MRFRFSISPFFHVCFQGSEMMMGAGCLGLPTSGMGHYLLFRFLRVTRRCNTCRTDCASLSYMFITGIRVNQIVSMLIMYSIPCYKFRKGVVWHSMV
jgi:hypothetical protein